MSPLQATLTRLTSIGIFAGVFVCALAGPAAAQNVLATIPIPTASAGQVAVDPALDLIYTGGATSGSGVTVINGSTFAVVTTLSSSAGVSVDMVQDNFWVGTLSSGNVNVYGSNDAQIFSFSVGSCPAAVAFDCQNAACGCLLRAVRETIRYGSSMPTLLPRLAAQLLPAAPLSRRPS